MSQAQGYRIFKVNAPCPDPPKISNAIFKAYTYKNGTYLTCNCTKGFRRKLPFMSCTGNSSHVSWENKCQCQSPSGSRPGKPITPKPEEQEEKKITEMASQTQSQVNLLGHCREPPPWEHETAERVYVFVVGQTVEYQCIEGYKARQRGPVTSTCRTVCGQAKWTPPRLTCTNELIPDKEEEELSLPESEISCPSITAVLKKPTEVATTVETFLFTSEYQIASGLLTFFVDQMFT
ncbi:PREDICTED: interleukin-2 receptor subunit alpha [Elephantulus edwardii]|uniref:interleukin-2 receptor subunit alpha n=1 Tax=Elephantulus edwardii TaxID=28737 RepID=UPI0003F0AAD9|nr:PREDICTED: interleukin-2 receptor subunit alpha [Elephantulus edwardii]